MIDFNSLNKSDLVSLLNQLRHLIENSHDVKKIEYKNSNYNIVESINTNIHTNSKKKSNNDLQSLIGTIPFLLLNEKLFPKNQDIANFAEQIKISIPSPEKKKKEDIIGRVIVGISKFDNKKLSMLNNIISKTLELESFSVQNDFFDSWERVIKNIKL